MPWNPLTDLTGLICWLDLSVTASVTLVSGKVDSIADQSASGLTASWGGFNRNPYSATGFNTSYPAMTDNPSVDAGCVRISSFPMGTGNELTAWFVGTNVGVLGPVNTNRNGRALSYAAPGVSDFNNAGSWCLTPDSGDFTRIQYARNSLGAAVNAAITSPIIIVITVDSSGLLTFYVNGVKTTSSTIPGNWVSGGIFSFGANAAGNQDFWYGALAEGGVCTAWHNDATIAQLTSSYLGPKWGVSVPAINNISRHRRDGGTWMRRGGVWRRVVPKQIIRPDNNRRPSHTILRAA